MFKLIGQQFNIEKPEQWWELNNEYQQARREIRNQMMRKIIKNEITLGKEDKFMTDMHNMLEEQKQQLKERTARKNNNSYLWVTVNPKPDVDLETFKSVVEKLVKKTCIDDYLYVYEQRGTTEDEYSSDNDEDYLGKGFHSHILIKRNLNYKPCKLITNIKNTCKHIVGNVNNNNQLNMQIIGEEFAEDKKTYILGKQKTGEGKFIKQAMDEIWRKKYNLKQYYNNVHQTGEQDTPP